MSTKIFDGVRIHLGASALFGFTAELAEQLGPVRHRLDAAATATLAAEVVDLAWAVDAGLATDAGRAHLERITAIPAVWAFGEIVRRQRDIRATGHRDPSVDFSFEITFVTDPTTGRIYAKPFTEHRAYLDVLAAHPAVSAFEFWNTTDRPDDVPADEWDARAAIWSRALTGPTWAASGLTWTLPESTAGVDARAIRAHLPTARTRANHLATWVHYGPVTIAAVNATCERLEPQLPPLDPDALFTAVPQPA